MSKAKKTPKPLCPLCHLECFACDEHGKCDILVDCKHIERTHHCGFYKKRNEVKNV